jgi:hypothetical protein
LYRDAALADGRSPTLKLGVSVLVDDGRIVWIRPTDSEQDPGDAEVIDAGGATIVPGMVDCHSHLTLPGGSHWIERIGDTPEQLVRHAEHNAKLQTNAGVRWARDVGAPVRVDPVDGRERALSLGLRERWRGQVGYPYVRAAGAWVTRAGTLPAGLTAEAEDADELLRLALQQLDDGADLVKLYLDGPDPDAAPWTANEVRRVVTAAHERGAKVTAHAGRLSGSRVCAEAGVDCIEHGFELDEDCARLMNKRGIALVSTLTVLKSWKSLDDDDRALRESGGTKARRRALGGGSQQHPPCARRRCATRRRHRLRRRLSTRQPARLGGGSAHRGGARAVGGSRVRHLEGG